MPGHTVEYFPDPPPAESGPFRFVSLPPPERASPPPFQVDTSYSLPASRIRSREIISIPSSSSSDVSPYSEIDSDSSILPVKRARTISPAAERAVEAAAAVVERESSSSSSSSSRRLPVGPPIPIDDEYHRSFDYDSQAASSSMESVRYLPPPPPPPPPPRVPSRIIPRAVQAARSAEVATYLMERAARKARRDAYQPPSYLIGAPNSFSNALSTLGRTGSHPDGSASHYGTYSK